MSGHRASPRSMGNLTVSAEWVEGEGLQGVEFAATWCSLTISVGEEYATRVFSRRSRTVRDDVLVSAYPLAEWISTSWWQLFAERENPHRRARHDFQATHSLVHARDGYALPDLTFACLGESCRLAWTPGLIGPYGVEFLTSGSTHVPTEEVRAALTDFVNQVVSRLVESEIEGTLLQDEWAAIQALDPEEVIYCNALASVGVDPFSASEEEAAAVVEAYESLPPQLISELSAVVDSSTVGHAASRVRQMLEDLNRDHLKLRHVAEIRDNLARGGASKALHPTPWGRGYSEARALRAELGLNGQPIGSLSRLAELIGEDAKELDDLVGGRDLGLDMVNGLTCTSEDGAFAVRLASSRPESTLFHTSRALGSYFFDPCEATALTKAVSDQQSRFRAFAAEFLVPAAGLREDIRVAVVDDEDIDEIAANYGVSSFVVHHQLQNHGIAQTSLRLSDSMPAA